MQAAGQQPAFDLHQLAVHRAHHAVAAVQFQLRGIHLGQGHVLVEVALARRFHDRVHDLHTPAAFAQLLVGAHSSQTGQAAEKLKKVLSASASNGDSFSNHD